MTASHHRPDGGFRNPWPTADDQALGGLWTWLRVHRTTPAMTTTAAADVSFPKAEPRVAQPRAGDSELIVTWIGHSTFLIQVDGMNVLTDPIWSDRASPLAFIGPRRRVSAALAMEALPPIHLVLISHDHYDHLDRRTVKRLAAHHSEARWLVPLGLLDIVRSFGARNVEEMDWWERRTIGSVTATCTPAQHWSGRGAFDRGRSLWCGWVVRTGARAVWFAGDTALHPDVAAIATRLGPFEAALLPIGGIEPRWYMRRLHLDPGEAVRAFLAVQHEQQTPALFVAMHWGSFRIADEPLHVPPAMLLDAWHSSGLPGNQLWIPAHGETRTLSIPPTSPVSTSVRSVPTSVTT